MFSDQVGGGAADGIDLNGLSLQRLFTMRASQHRFEGLTALVVNNFDIVGGFMLQPIIAPAHRSNETDKEVSAFIGQGILERCSNIFPHSALEEPTFCQPLKTSRQWATCDTEVLLEFAETLRIVKDCLTQHQP